MFGPHPSDPHLLKTLLEPLLEDFQYWFEQSRTLLETQEIQFLGSEKQGELLNRVQQAQQEIRTTQMLLRLTDNQVGVETTVLMIWHQLVMEYWQVAIRYRLEKSPE